MTFACPWVAYKYYIPFKYNVSVKRENYFSEQQQANFEKVIVHLTMHWYEYCGLPCGWGFKKERKVIFTSPYQIEEIIGDDKIKKWVSNKKDPYGLEWFSF